mgnify:CR=1 FL=1
MSKSILVKLRSSSRRVKGPFTISDNYGNVITNIKREFFETIQKGRAFEVSARNYKFKKIHDKKIYWCGQYL